MNSPTARSSRAVAAPEPIAANDRFKETFRTKLALSLLLATTLHVVLIETWPTMEVDQLAATTSVPEVIELPPDVVIPPAPHHISRPAAPIAAPNVSAEETLPVFEWSDVPSLPPPPPVPEAAVAPETSIPFTPYTVAPTLRNPEQFQEALQRAYPESLRRAAIGGTVLMLVNIDDKGIVRDARIRTGSGYASLDDAALGLADLMSFTPALNRDKKVAVWIALPIVFEIR